jgi:hypothetical protein
MELFVSGQLTTHEAVAEQLRVSLGAVQKQSHKFGWVEARKRRVEQLVARVAELPPLQVERSKEGLEEIAKLQEQLAKSLLASAVKMQEVRDHAIDVENGLLTRLASIDPGAHRDGLQERLACVQSLEQSLSENLRVLAGLPHPDKMPRQLQRQAMPEPIPFKEPDRRVETAQPL